MSNTSSQMIGYSVRSLQEMLDRLGGNEAVAALGAGNPLVSIDPQEWAQAWEGAGPFRELFVITVARFTRDRWRSDVTSIVSNAPESQRPDLISRALAARLQVSLALGFKWFSARQVCMLGDALALAFEPEINPADFYSEIASNAARTPGCTNANVHALMLGLSGMHRQKPESLLASHTEVKQ
ncbi:MAG: hypothetical protein O9327_05035 [Polaromonas sp.]|nr:hypothetical protein [Polaromonas sp.]